MRFLNPLKVAMFIVVASCGMAHAKEATPLKNMVFPSYDPAYPPPDGIPTDQVFELSQDYPKDFNRSEKFPWETINFKLHAHSYLRSVLEYCIEGNLDTDFKVQNNPIRKWYHAPWLHSDGRINGAGREFRHGLTQERTSRPEELHPAQKSQGFNWAVGFYNDRGGYALGQVWRVHQGYPDPTKATFPENSVACKMLFTDSDSQSVPYLKGTKSWIANIYPTPDSAANPTDPLKKLPRSDREVRLLQFDVAVKEPRLKGGSGWIFGTFVYDASAPVISSDPRKQVFERLIPVGLAWGDDATVSKRMKEDGAFVNTDLAQTYINESLVERPGFSYNDRAFIRHYGLGGRFSGPVDNPASSCISCHARAAVLSVPPTDNRAGLHIPIGPGRGVSKPSLFNESRFAELHSAIVGGAHAAKYPVEQGETYNFTDYSLQVSAGIRNFYAVTKQEPAGETGLFSSSVKKRFDLPPVNRGE